MKIPNAKSCILALEVKPNNGVPLYGFRLLAMDADRPFDLLFVVFFNSLLFRRDAHIINQDRTISFIQFFTGA